MFFKIDLSQQYNVNSEQFQDVIIRSCQAILRVQTPYILQEI